ncbi:uncharacterized protein LOC118740030 [Rhagoletis pomonella]|uniref:uncharacterized protein LOC118740030 n=1 Tax=Rhagoletis pomonella TaxID=28610 RepID=UPI001784DE35|nr:uncharacterized protein LOC118740030 [Rhagoletis pomonella]
MSARLEFIVLNTGAATTFRRPGCEETTPDITLASEGIAGTIKEWKVLEDYTGSDHQYISFIIDSKNDGLRKKMQCSTRKWNVSKLNSEALSEIDAHGSEESSYNNAMEIVETTMKMISRACTKAMPTTGSNRHKTPAYWWTENIAQLRRTCFHLRRTYTRARRRSAAVEEAQLYQAARKELKRAIEASKDRKWKELCEDINRNPWGLGYKVAMKKLGAMAKPPELSAQKIDYIVSELFPTHEALTQEMEPIIAPQEIPPFTAEELKSATNKGQEKVHEPKLNVAVLGLCSNP